MCGQTSTVSRRSFSAHRDFQSPAVSSNESCGLTGFACGARIVERGRGRPAASSDTRSTASSSFRSAHGSDFGRLCHSRRKSSHGCPFETGRTQCRSHASGLEQCSRRGGCRDWCSFCCFRAVPRTRCCCGGRRTRRVTSRRENADVARAGSPCSAMSNQRGCAASDFGESNGGGFVLEEGACSTSRT